MAKKTSRERRASAKTSRSTPAVKKAGTLVASAANNSRRLTARPDGLDFRDNMYVPSLVEVPTAIKLEDYLKVNVPILDQGQEGACTGYGLATVAHYLLRTRRVVRSTKEVSPHMLYDLARRYDEWKGVDYEGSSCRGAMKGWFKHGVCGREAWPAGMKETSALTDRIALDAATRPLGAYYRVNHKDLVAMHAAIAEVGILYASGTVHTGWEKVGRNGLIPFEDALLGGHAFAIVAYDREGFWLQNSWGKAWGRRGFGHIGYQDWMDNGTDVWVARLGVPVAVEDKAGARANVVANATTSRPLQYNEIRPHVISIGNDGQLDGHGDIGTSPEMVREILHKDFPRITQGWRKKRLVLYAHGGLVAEDGALQRVAEYRKTLLEAECYPLAFIWKSDYWTTLKDMLEDAVSHRRPEGILDSAKDFMLDRLDDALEPIARLLTGKASWDEMKENALMATTTSTGGARIVCDELAKLKQDYPELEIHVVGHSAGSIFHAPLVQYLTSSLDLPIKTCTLWAPACTVDLFRDAYLGAIENNGIGQLALFTLTDKAEQDDDCARIYNKSLLYLVSNAFEETVRIPLIHPDGESIFGMEKFVRKDAEIQRLLKAGRIDWVLSPNNEPDGSVNAAKATHHGDFDDDDLTLRATLARILGKTSVKSEFDFHRGRSSNRRIRRYIDKFPDATVTR